jgi:hypothetical protein
MLESLPMLYLVGQLTTALTPRVVTTPERIYAAPHDRVILGQFSPWAGPANWRLLGLGP